MRPNLLVTVALLLAAATATHADTATYNLLFAPQYPQVDPPSLVGSFVLNVPPPAAGVARYSYPSTSPNSPNNVESLSFNVGPEHFDLSDLFPILNPAAPNPFEVDFTNGNLSAISGQFTNRNTSIAFGTETISGFGSPLTVEFFDSFGTASTYLASATSVASPTPTPEPATLALLATGLLGLVLTRRALP